MSGEVHAPAVLLLLDSAVLPVEEKAVCTSAGLNTEDRKGRTASPPRLLQTDLGAHSLRNTDGV